MQKLKYVHVRFFSVGNNIGKRLNTELTEFMHGRGYKERRDSITNEILFERSLHLKRLESIEFDSITSKSLGKQGLGKKGRRNQVYAPVSDKIRTLNRKTNSGAGTSTIDSKIKITYILKNFNHIRRICYSFNISH